MEMFSVNKLWQPILRRLYGGEIVLIHEFHKPPYGGGNQFMIALKGELLRRGIDIGSNHIGSRTKAVLFNFFNFDFDKLKRMHRTGVRMVHRVDGPVSVYRGKDVEIDKRIWEINRDLANSTVFQSHYSLEKNRLLGFEFVNPVVIHNASDPMIFHSVGRIFSPRTNKKVRLVSTSWSDNPRKGQAVYKWLDEHLDINKYDYTFVGRCQAEFRRIRRIDPLPSRELANILRQNHIFIMPSQFESCSNALVEALSCGLPSVYHSSGSNAELVKDAGFGFLEAEEIPFMLDRIVADYETFQKRICNPSLSEVADEYLGLLLEPAFSPDKS
jgi:glycosyltransferase involved in cell wall biosynthesis